MMRRVIILLAAAVTFPSVALGAPPEDVGKEVFRRWCSACHAPGDRSPGTAALAAKYGKEQPAALEERQDLEPDLVRYFVRQGVSVMPSFRKTEITDAELDALADYLGPARAKARARRARGSR